MGGVELNLRNFVHNDLGVILPMQNTSANEVEESFNIPWGTVYDLGAEHLYELKLLDWDGDGVANDVALADTDGPWSRAVLESGKSRELARAYLACVSFMDACVGRVLDALEKSPYAKNTVVILLGDNGMHIGEKDRFSKFTLWERSTRTPLMIRALGSATGK